MSNSLSYTYHGSDSSFAVFSNDTKVAVIDVDLGVLVEFGDKSHVLASKKWDFKDTYVDSCISDLASLVLSADSPESLVASARLYTIPENVQAEAKKALEWRKEHRRGGTSVGLNTARTLAKGGQIGIEKMRHIAKYFPRHEVDKKGKGWKPGEDNFPSNGRIAWALWGGDGAWRWARAIVERENKKALKAGADYDSNVSDFRKSYDLEPSVAPEFLARVRMDGSGIDRIYKIDMDGTVYVWDDGIWDDLGSVEQTAWTLDAELDEPEDSAQKTHVIIDPESAIQICAKLQTNPFNNVLISELDEEEYELAVGAIEEEDWNFVDSVTSNFATIVAAPDAPMTDQQLAESREKTAENQPRDALGQFARIGARVAVGGDTQRGLGKITDIDGKTGFVKVLLDDGRTIEVSSKYTQDADSIKGPIPVPDMGSRLDLSGILGEPTALAGTKARLGGTTAPMTRESMQLMLTNYPAYVAAQRASYTPYKDSDIPKGKGYPTSGLAEYDRKYMKERYGLNAAAEGEESVEASPSDVPPIYLAIVAPDDVAAVTNLISIVPAGKNSTEPMTYVRKDAKWVRDGSYLEELKSATPPDVVKLDDEELDSVLTQVDEAMTASGMDLALMVLWGPKKEVMNRALLARGGLDRNRGGAAKLRRYWTIGKGGKKIRWRTGGDWTRCVRYLRKYLGPRAKGYCALRHKEMTGMWTGDRKHRKLYGRVGSNTSQFSTNFIKSKEDVINSLTLEARKTDVRNKMALVASSLPGYSVPAPTVGVGSKFVIPLVIPEDTDSGDGRKFEKNAITFRELPLPLMWQIKTGDGHSGSVVVGRIDYMERTEKGIGNAYGYFDTSSYALEVERLIRNGFVKGVSADMDRFEAVEEEDDSDKEAAKSSKKTMGKDRITINKARVMGITIVPKPAFQECMIFLDSEQQTINPQEEPVLEDGIYVDDVDELDASSLVACAYVAGAIPVSPPADWFAQPKLAGPTPLTIEDDGRVYGHIAAWQTNHIGLPFGTKPPRSKSKYAYFHTGALRTEEGKDVPVGQLTLAGGHAPLEASAHEAVKHYDDTASAFADVHAGEDQFGIWVAGSLRPGTTPEQVRAARASAPSGDWRPIRNSLELVAVCQVNVPGFPIARARVASGAVMALVAAGAQTLAKMKSDPITEMQERLAKLERPELNARAEELKSRVASITAGGLSDYAVISPKIREKLAKEGKALKDGSFPIRNVSDLKNAIQAYGRAKDKDAAKKHIIKRAKDLQRYYDLIPEEWRSKRYKAASNEEVESMKARVASAQDRLGKALAVETKEEVSLPNGEVAPEGEIPTGPESGLKDPETGRYTPQTQPRDEAGKFRRVLARLKDNLGTAGLQKVLKEAKYLEKVHELGDYVESVNSGAKLLDI